MRFLGVEEIGWEGLQIVAVAEELLACAIVLSSLAGPVSYSCN